MNFHIPQKGENVVTDSRLINKHFASQSYFPLRLLILRCLISRNLFTCLMTEEMSHQAKDDVFVFELNNHLIPLALWPYFSCSVSAASLRHIGFQIFTFATVSTQFH